MLEVLKDSAFLAWVMPLLAISLLFGVYSMVKQDSHRKTLDELLEEKRKRSKKPPHANFRTRIDLL